MLQITDTFIRWKYPQPYLGWNSHRVIFLVMANLIHIGVLYSAILAWEGPRFLFTLYVCMLLLDMTLLPPRTLPWIFGPWEFQFCLLFLNSLIIFFIYLIHSYNSYTNINIQKKFFMLASLIVLQMNFLH